MIKPQAYETEVIDKLFLELSQVTRATTGKELRLTERLAEVSVRAEKAEQESARLREALAALLDCCMDTLASGRPVAHMDTAMEAARTALGGE